MRRSTSVRSESPAIGPASRRKLVAVEGSNESRPDPAEFEKAFVIEDESEGPSRSVTPALPDGAGNGDKSSVKLEGGAENNDQASEITLVQELPPDVKAKLRKLEKLESRYQGTFVENFLVIYIILTKPMQTSCDHIASHMPVPFRSSHLKRLSRRTHRWFLLAILTLLWNISTNYL